MYPMETRVITIDIDTVSEGQVTYSQSQSAMDDRGRDPSGASSNVVFLARLGR